MADIGFTLNQIRQLFETEPEKDNTAALHDLAMNNAGNLSLTRSEIASQAEVPESLISLLCDNGLLQPLFIDEEPRFDKSAISMVKAGLAIAAAGVPFEDLMDIASDHAKNVEGIVERATELFEKHIKTRSNTYSDNELTETIKILLPSITHLVAQHFHQSLTSYALKRTKTKKHKLLANALIAADIKKLIVTCKWR